MTHAQSAQTALDKLIEAVEAGTLTGDDDLSYPAGVPEMIDTALGMDTVWDTVCLAHDGSLDAALALHEALLPGRTLSVGQNAHYGDWNAWVRYAEDGTILDEYTAASDTAARSLLLAILRAYRSTQP